MPHAEHTLLINPRRRSTAYASAHAEWKLHIVLQATLSRLTHSVWVLPNKMQRHQSQVTYSPPASELYISHVLHNMMGLTQLHS